MQLHNLVKELLFLLVRAALGRDSIENCPQLSEAEWQELFSLACRHNIAALVAEQVGRLPELVRPSEDCCLQFVAMQGIALSEFHHKKEVAQRLQMFFAKHQLNVVFLKGFRLCQYYPRSELRTFSDLDIFLSYAEDGSSLEPAWKVGDRWVEKELGVSVHRDIHHHTTFDFVGVHVENHFDFIPQYGCRNAKDYERLLKALPVNSPDFNALFLMRHMAGHFAAEHISIRHLVDWMLFLQHEGEQVHWDKIKEIYDTFGMTPFVETVSGVVQTYLRYACPYLGVSLDETLRERVVNEILYGEFSDDMPDPSQVVKRLSFKWKRRWQGRWKHNLCSNTPWIVDLSYAIFAKIMKPRTILH